MSQVALLTGGGDGCIPAVADRLKQQGFDIAVPEADPADAASFEAALRHVRAELGDPSVLVHRVALDSAGADRYAAIRRGLRSSFVCCRAVSSRMMRGRWGRILLVTEFDDNAPDRPWRAGAELLSGLIGFTRTVAADLAAIGVTVNLAAPADCRPDELPAVAEMRARMPGPAYADSVAALAAFLTGDDAAAVTGQTTYLA